MPNDVPKNWPQDIIYLSKPHYSAHLHTDKVKALNNLDAFEASSLLQAPVRIQHITDVTHPAHEQYGLFAAAYLPPSSFVLFYIGYVHDERDTDEASDYDLSLDRELGIAVDASRMGNEARFVNDYRGVADGPNAEFKEVVVNIQGQAEKRMGLFVLPEGKSGKGKGIRKGQEVLVSYGKGFWKERRGPDDTPDGKQEQEEGAESKGRSVGST